jgi:glycosyltransferase involved in cell wall biosynthesis
MSLWCKKWLKERFGKDAIYASNGIDLNYFKFQKRNFNKDKIKIMIEGDSRSEYKNTDEAFKIVAKLDPKKYEISYLSYRKEPKDWYRVDHFYNRIPLEKVGEIYAKCDILIKTSLLESFSYPPLEMMATGGVSVVVPNDGNVEYLRDGENCLFYQQGNIDDGVAKGEQLVHDKALRDKIIKGGLQTAKRYEWQNIEKDILALYQ